jgi:glycosyltransferase involved in cell wall biosynthesis
MTVRRVNQLVAGFAEGDAISQEARAFRHVARELGFESEIFVPACRMAPGCRDDCRPLEDYRGETGDLVIYHYAIASECSAIFEATAARRVLLYHNITPASYFDGFDDETAARLRVARGGLKTVASLADRVAAVSAFNAAELAALGVADVRVFPLLWLPGDMAVEPDPAMLHKLGDGLRNMLFVGRMAPNKCIEDLLLAFAWYHTCIDRHSRLVIVGSERSCPRYAAMLGLLAGRLGLANVSFAGFVSPAELAACYATASVFVCTSRHEGYCLPLVEAMLRGVPVIARDCGGMPEAMGGGGVLFDEADPRILAQLMHRVLTDDDLRAEVLDSQAQRVAAVRSRDAGRDVRDLFEWAQA